MAGHKSGVTVQSVADARTLLVQGDRDCRVAQGARRVVLTSLGVLKDQDAHRKRSRSLALAATLLVLLIVGPLLWHAVDSLIAGDFTVDLSSQFALWVCILCPALLAAALVAGWLHKG